MIQLKRSYDCCGCEACVQVCPKRCISFVGDREGFLYPSVEEHACIACGLCEKVCPVLNQTEPASPVSVCAARNRNEKDLLQSSSGGLFVAMARKVLGMGGVVFGAAFSPDCLSVRHVAVQDERDLPALMGSKYLQSRIGDNFSQAKAFLETGRQVLFCGTGCQIRALNLFLRKEYANLVTVDLICHGVPSPKVWGRYLTETVPAGATVDSVSFRDKRTGWSTYSFTVNCSGNGSDSVGRISHLSSRNPYMWLFLNDYTIRPSCYQCPAKGGKSLSDITIADYWGIEEVHPDFFDEKGVGLLIVNSGKGKDFIAGLELDTRDSTLESAVRGNPSYEESPREPAGRGLFFKRFSSGRYSVERISRGFYRRKKWAGIPGRIIRKLRRIKKHLI